MDPWGRWAGETGRVSTHWSWAREHLCPANGYERPLGFQQAGHRGQGQVSPIERTPIAGAQKRCRV